MFNRPRTRLYCVGTAKSGTHSLAAMFADRVRAQHEPQAAALIEKILDYSNGKISMGALQTWVVKRDTKLRLAVDSSQLNFFILEILLQAFKDARFVLTIRDCYSWLDSMISHSKFQKTSSEWNRLRDYRFKPDYFAYSVEERLLAENGLYTLDGYLSYWKAHNEKVLDIVPVKQLLVVRTDQISRMAYQIADFSGLPRNAVNIARTHNFKSQQKLKITEFVNRDFLAAKAQQHCAGLMERFFPDVKETTNQSV